MKRILAAFLALIALTCPGLAEQRPKIVGGKPARVNEWPATGTLRYLDAANRTSGHVCGGSVIAPTWFLTAAHCLVRHADENTLSGEFVDDAGAAITGLLQVVLGHDDLKAVTVDSVYDVDRVVVHEAFLKAYREARSAGLSPLEATDRATITSGHDIALVALKRPWQGEVARLLLDATEPKQHRWFADVFGFGYVDRVAEKRRMRRYARPNDEVYFAGTSQLMRVGVPIVESLRCTRRYRSTYPAAAIGDGQICAGTDTGGRDSCQGDSGGPLVASYEDRPQTYQIGLVSWGHGCAEPGWPGIYTRLSAHADWLRAHVGELKPDAVASGGSGAAPPTEPAGRPPDTAKPAKLLFANWSPKSFEPSVAGGAEFAEELNKLGGGSLDIAHFFAGEIVPGGPAAIDAVTWGNIDMAWASPGFSFRRTAAFALLGNAVPFGMQDKALAAWMRGEGAQLMQRLFDRYNIVALPCAIMGERGSGWFRKPLAGVADLQGLKINVGQFYAEIFARAGASPQRIRISEVWPALKDGRLDAAIFETPEFDEKLRYYEPAPYYYFPGWHYRNTPIALLVSDRAWAGLSDGQKALIEQACAQNIDRTLARSRQSDAVVIARLVGAGARLQQLPTAVEAVLRQATADYFAQEAAADPDFAAVLESYRRHQAAASVASDPPRETSNPAAASPVSPPIPAVTPPTAQAAKAEPRPTAKRTRKREAQGKSWREEVFQPK